MALRDEVREAVGSLNRFGGTIAAAIEAAKGYQAQTDQEYDDRVELVMALQTVERVLLGAAPVASVTGECTGKGRNKAVCTCAFHQQ